MLFVVNSENELLKIELTNTNDNKTAIPLNIQEDQSNPIFIHLFLSANDFFNTFLLTFK